MGIDVEEREKKEKPCKKRCDILYRRYFSTTCNIPSDSCALETTHHWHSSETYSEFFFYIFLHSIWKESHKPLPMEWVDGHGKYEDLCLTVYPNGSQLPTGNKGERER